MNTWPRHRSAIIGLLLLLAAGVITLRVYQLSRPGPPAFPTGVMRVAIDPSVPPFASFDENEQLVGIDVDLALALGEELGLPVDLRIIGIDGLYDALYKGDVDLVISALNAETWRMGDVLYSHSYYDAGLLLVTPAQSDINSMRELPGHALAYAFGSSADTEARAWSRRIPAFETRPYELPEYALDALRQGDADAALVDAVSVDLYTRQHSDFAIETHYVTHAPLVIAVRIHQTGTFRRLNEALRTLIEDGSVARILDEWL